MHHQNCLQVCYLQEYWYAFMILAPKVQDHLFNLDPGSKRTYLGYFTSLTTFNSITNIKLKLLPAVNNIFIFWLSQIGLLTMYTVLNSCIILKHYIYCPVFCCLMLCSVRGLVGSVVTVVTSLSLKINNFFYPCQMLIFC